LLSIIRYNEKISESKIKQELSRDYFIDLFFQIILEIFLSLKICHTHELDVSPSIIILSHMHLYTPLIYIFFIFFMFIKFCFHDRKLPFPLTLGSNFTAANGTVKLVGLCAQQTHICIWNTPCSIYLVRDKIVNWLFNCIRDLQKGESFRHTHFIRRSTSLALYISLTAQALELVCK